jgi:hypothetical protein
MNVSTPAPTLQTSSQTSPQLPLTESKVMKARATAKITEGHRSHRVKDLPSPLLTITHQSEILTSVKRNLIKPRRRSPSIATIACH